MPRSCGRLRVSARSGASDAETRRNGRLAPAIKGLTHMPMNCRFESRMLFTVPLFLRDAADPTQEDLGLTENVSPCGARIITKRRAQAGEQWQISHLSGGAAIPARVVYCEAVSNRSFCVGLELPRPTQGWWNQSRPGRREAAALRTERPEPLLAQSAEPSNEGGRQRSREAESV